MKYNMENNNEKKIIFANGLFWRTKPENAPESLRGKLLVQVESFIKFLNDNDEYRSDKGWLPLNLWKSKTGTYYFSVDTFKPKPKEDPELKALRDNHNASLVKNEAVINSEDVPF